MSAELFVGIDVGTTGCKAAAYSRDGRLQGKGYARNRLISNRPGQAEESPEQWWENACACVRAAVGTRGGDVRGLSISAAGGLVPVDTEGRALHNAVMQMDKRALTQLEALRPTMDASGLAIARNRLTDGISAVQYICWFRDETPELYRRTAWFLPPNAYLAMRMTGRPAGEWSRCSTTMLLDVEKGAWSPTLVSLAGVDATKLPPVLAGTKLVGKLEAEAARAMGLEAGIPVAAGGMDTAAAGVGCGARQPGDGYAVLGTFGKYCALSDGRQMNGEYVNARFVDGDASLTFAPIDGGAGLAVDWLRGLLSLNGQGGYDTLNALAASAPPGCRGLRFLPWMAGARMPVRDSKARAAFLGLSTEHGAGHLARAILEGVALSARACRDGMRQGGKQSERLRLCGGGAHSAVWAQIFADALCVRVEVPSDPDTETAGAAAIACKAVTGEWLAPPATASAYEPQTDAVRAYDDAYERFCQDCAAMTRPAEGKEYSI